MTDLIVKATYERGTLRLAEPLPLPDGETVDVTVSTGATAEHAADAIKATSGAWADLLDCRGVRTKRIRATASSNALIFLNFGSRFIPSE